MHVTHVTKKIKHLIERAAHETTPAPEARTCALLAAKLIVRHGVPIGPSGGAIIDQRTPGPCTMPARYADRCVGCHAPIAVGERIEFALDRGSTCGRCLRRARRRRAA